MVNYVRGVVAGFQRRGEKIPALDVAMISTVPLGGGLSSSAALEVCTATLVEAVTGTKIDPVEKALLCQKAEHEFAGVPCGIMDQFISVLGQKDHLLLLDCRSRNDGTGADAATVVAILITNTNVKHELGSGEYAKRRAQCEAAAKSLGVPSLRDASAELLEAQPRPNGRGCLSAARGTSSAKLSARFTPPRASAPRTGRPSASSCMPATPRCATITK